MRNKLTALSIAMLCWICSPTVTAGPSPEAGAIISELGLRATGKRLSDNSAWRPQRVVVSAPESFIGRMPDFETKLQEAAGDVELIIDKSPNLVPSAESLADADAIIGLCTAPTMKNASANLLWIHNYFAGMDTCTGLSEDQKIRTVFTNSKRLAGPTIADHSIALMLSLARGLPAFQTAQSKSRWQPNLASSVQFGEIRGKTLLVAGLGGIGTQIAARAHGLGMRVIATRNSSRDGPEYVDYVGLSNELHKLAGEADVIVNALPLTQKTRSLFDADFFNSSKRGAIFISVGRGKSTVTADLVDALKSGRIRGAGLDVTDPEPLPPTSPLWQMSNVIITPHVAANGPDSLRRTVIIALENLRRYVAGEALLNVVNMQAGY